MSWIFVSHYSCSNFLHCFQLNSKQRQACRNTDVTSILISVVQISHYGVHMELASFPSVTECVSSQKANLDPIFKLHWQETQPWDLWRVLANLATRV